MIFPSNADAISIHPPRAGRDNGSASEFGLFGDFNPPSPCGEGPDFSQINIDYWAFQSTLPVRGGTLSGKGDQIFIFISIHPPRAGRDSKGSQITRCKLLRK